MPQEQSQEQPTEATPEQVKQLETIAEIWGRKEELHPDLKPYLGEVEGLGVCLRHPLVYSMLHHEMMNAMVNKQYAHKKQYIEDCLAKKDYSGIIWMHERPYRWEVLMQYADKMSDKELWHLFGSIWSDTENQWQYRKSIQDLINCGRPGRENMMDEEERQFLAELPDEVCVFRGHQHVNKNGYSWTLCYWRAKWFGRRLLTNGRTYGVVAGTVKKSDIIAVLLGRGEMEIAVEPNKVYDKKAMPIKRPAYFQQVLDVTLPMFTLGKNSIHGLEHWEKVEHNAVELAANTPGADPLVCRLFALIHDCKRENENTDPKHGPRAARIVSDLQRDGVIKLDTDQLGKLIYACAKHDNGLVSKDPTIGCCWDADRLDLMRVGIHPDPALLSTEYGKTHVWRI